MTLKITSRTYNRQFVEKLEKISGESFHRCMQCGTCTGGCPMMDEMDASPRQLVLAAHFGLREFVLNANTAWLCATCSTCSTRCPRGVDITKLMEGIRQIALRENENHIEPNQLPSEILRKVPQIALVGCFRKHTS